jgi:hypothetical protein
MTAVLGSCASARMPSIIIVPPTCSERSRPPVPMSWEMPAPKPWTRTLTSWAPVPDAATTPMEPGRTALPKHSATLLRIAVPQSGPIISRPFSWAVRLRLTSSSTDTLSLKSMTCSPASSAWRASRAA